MNNSTDVSHLHLFWVLNFSSSVISILQTTNSYPLYGKGDNFMIGFKKNFKLLIALLDVSHFFKSKE